MAKFEDLVPDVLFLLLLGAPCMQTLWGYIRASSRMYDVFCHHREIILSTIVTREIGPGILGDAQAALDSSRFEARGLFEKEALEWIAWYKAGTLGNTTLPNLSLGSDAVPLWRMHQDVKFFAELYIRERLHILGCMELIVNPVRWDLDELSSIERMRIYRALYRYAIFGNLFYYNDVTHGRRKTKSAIGSYEQSHNLLRLFSAWQVEELICINDFSATKSGRSGRRLRMTITTSLKTILPAGKWIRIGTRAAGNVTSSRILQN